MNHSVRAFLLLSFLAFSSFLHAQQADMPFTVPEISQYEPQTGTLQPKGAVIVNGNAQTLAQAKRFAEDFEKLTGKPLKVVRNKKGVDGNIVLELQPKLKFQKEEYQIDVNQQVKVTASDSKGLWWGLQTVLQMIEQDLRPFAQYAHLGESACQQTVQDCRRDPLHLCAFG